MLNRRSSTRSRPDERADRRGARPGRHHGRRRRRRLERQNQNASTAHGMGGEQATVLLDGIQLNGMCGNGATQSYSNTQNYEEIVVQNSGAGADVSARRRAPEPHYETRAATSSTDRARRVYASGNWQADALTPDLVARGLTKGDTFDNIYDYEAGLGGRIRSRTSCGGFRRRAQERGEQRSSPTRSIKDGSQGINDQYVKNVSAPAHLRRSIQRHQLNVYNDRVFKYLGHDDERRYRSRDGSHAHVCPRRSTARASSSGPSTRPAGCCSKRASTNTRPIGPTPTSPA